MRFLIVNNHVSKALGGSEVQSDLIARSFAPRADVVYLCFGQHEQMEEYAGYRVHTIPHSKRLLVQTLRTYKPDVIYWRFGLLYLRSVVSNARDQLGIFVYAASHQDDVGKFEPISVWSVLFRFRVLMRALRMRYRALVNLSALEAVDAVTVNNGELVECSPHPTTIHIPNDVNHAIGVFSWPRPYIIWVANIKPSKQPEFVVQLARELLGEVDVIMIGKVQSSSFPPELAGDGGSPENFHYLGALSYEDVNAAIDKSLFLIHTCRPEGFPNVFLQAWARSKAVVSLSYDPENLIATRNLGRYSQDDFVRFVSDVRELLIDSRRADIEQSVLSYWLARAGQQSGPDRLWQLISELST